MQADRQSERRGLVEDTNRYAFLIGGTCMLPARRRWPGAQSLIVGVSLIAAPACAIEVPACLLPACALQVAEELRVLRHFNCSFEPLPADSARSSESAPAAAAAGKNMMRSKAAATPSSGAAVSAAAKGSAKDDASKQRGRPGAAAAKAAASNAASLNNYTAEDAEDDATKVAAAEATAEADLERLSGGRALLATGAEAKAELDLSPPMVKAPKGKAPKPHTPEGSRRRSSSSGIGWERSPGLPSWNDCFRCMFSYCGGYEGPRAGGVCTESLGRWGRRG